MEHARDYPGVTITNETEDYAILSINGPKSRDLLSDLTSDDVSAKGFKFMENRRMKVGGINVLALCVSYTGKKLLLHIFVAPFDCMYYVYLITGN